MPREARIGDADDLEPDVTEITDIKERENEQLKYYGGDPIEDEDDLATADRGDSLFPEEEEENEDRGDQVEKDESEEEPAGDEEGESGDEEDNDESGDEGEDADSEAEDSDDGDSGDTEEPESDQVEEEEEEDKEEPKASDQRVPLSRFNEINERRKEAERRVQELESEDKAAEDAKVEKFDFDAAEEEYMELLLDGKTKEAGAKRREIRAAEQELFTSQAKEEAVTDVNQQQQITMLNDLSAEAEGRYPILNEGHQDYNPKVAQRVITYMKGYMAEGQPASDALVSGLVDVIDQYDLDTKYGYTEQPSDEETEETKPEPKVTKKKPIRKTKEKIETAKKQAAPVATGGENADAAGAVVPDIENMTDEEYDALPEATKARMRGDVL